jgi:hypothetical protein
MPDSWSMSQKNALRITRGAWRDELTLNGELPRTSILVLAH